MKDLYPQVVCADGVKLSVQASRTHYCGPREDEGPYHRVEVGFIQDAAGNMVRPPDSWRKFADGSEFPNDVYGYVPVELVEEFIAAHGGATGDRPSK